MTFRGPCTHADCACRRNAAGPRAGSLRRSGRAVAAALRRHGRQGQSLTARLMGDPPPGRSALAARARRSDERIPARESAVRDMSFARPVDLIEPADPYDELDAAILAGRDALGE